MQLGGLRGRFVGVALAGVGQRNALSIVHLHFFYQTADLRTGVLVGWRDDGGRQVPEHVNGHVRLAAFMPLGPVVARSVHALRYALQRA